MCYSHVIEVCGKNAETELKIEIIHTGSQFLQKGEKKELRRTLPVCGTKQTRHFSGTFAVCIQNGAQRSVVLSLTVGHITV